MADNNSLKTQDYSLEWMDHLYAIYANFKRRNDIGEWAYFLGRPELSNPKEFEKIANQVMDYILKLPNISQKIAQILEDTFRYSDSRSKYEDVFGYGYMEFFFRKVVGTKEFPPYELFGDVDTEAPYDVFLDDFYALYYSQEEMDEEVYGINLEVLKGHGIEHPYIALLESEFCTYSEKWGEALQWLAVMDESYHKNMAMGTIFYRLEDYDSAETCFENAYTLNEGFFDNALITCLVMSKWQNGKKEEALDKANEFAALGYEHDVLPLKFSFLDEFSKILTEKAKCTELTEQEMLLLKEYCLMKGDYEAIKRLCNMAWEKGFVDDSWTVDMAEAYLETGEKQSALEIVNMVYSGQKLLNENATLKIREIKARLLFEDGKIREAYDIMHNICKALGATIWQKQILASMYKKTGRLESATTILNELFYNAPYNMAYSYELGRCFLEGQKPEKAHYHFDRVCQVAPDFRNVAYYLVQASIDEGEDRRAEKELEQFGQFISDDYIRFIQGQFSEMKEDYKTAQQIYSDLIGRYENAPYDKKLLHEAADRYFLIRQENGARVLPLVMELKDALKKIPDAAGVWYFLGDLYERSDIKEGAAEECYIKAIEADPYHLNSLLSLLELYLTTDKNVKARELVDRIIVYTDDVDMYVASAHLALEMGELDRCISDIKEYERRCGINDEVGELKAQVLLKQGEYEAALEQYEELNRTKNVKTMPYYDSIAICMCKCGKFDEAEELLDIVCQTSKNALYHMHLYNIQVYRSKFKEAKYTLKRYKEVCELGLLDDHHAYLSAKLMLDSGLGPLGQAAAEAIASTDGERLCAAIELVNKNYRKAVKLFKKLVKKQDDNVDNYSWLALALYSQGKTGEAAEIAQTGLCLLEEFNGDIDSVKTPEVLCQYAFLKTMQEEFDIAEKYYDKAADMPTCTHYICKECYESHFGKGVMYGCKGQRKKAMDEFDKSLKIRKSNYICKKIKKWL